MGFFDSVSGAINSATKSVSSAISSATSFLSEGPANALVSIAGVLSGSLGGLGNAFKPLPGVKLPIPNPLFNYASYDYVIGIAVLTDDQMANPSKYMNGQTLPLVCKSANADPNNRVKSEFGKFDFFIDNVEIECSMGMEGTSSTNMLNMSFTITEPYSMGGFLLAIQEAGQKAGHLNYMVDCPFLLTIDFRGNTETGNMVNIPQTSRKIPFNFTNVSMTVNENGAVYTCTCTGANSKGQSAHTSQIKNDASISGLTVQEVLQTGSKSLQVMLNKRLQQLKTEKVVNTPDRIYITFPQNIASDPPGSGASDDNTGATVSVSEATADAVAKQLGLIQSSLPENTTLVQDPKDVNILGKAKMGYDDTRKGDAPIGKDRKVYDDKGNIIRSQNPADSQISDIRFSQDTDIATAINTVLLNSDYAPIALSEGAVDKTGFRTWWRIDIQVYNITDNSNMGSTGTKPKIIVYRVVPYKVHSGAVGAPNSKPAGYDALSYEIVKQYDYIYTGKNIDIINFNVTIDTSFSAIMGASSIKRTGDAVVADSASGSTSDTEKLQPIPQGKAPSTAPGTIPTSVRHSATATKLDKKGAGGGLETEDTRASKLFHDAIQDQGAMQQLEMTIIGDPYYIAHSGISNYTATPSQYSNLNSDGSINHQNGEVDIIVNFRSPLDINQSTGLYDFGKSTKTAPVLMFSGLYKLLTVSNHFKGGQFTQTLKGNRRPSQEIPGPGSYKVTLSTSTPSRDPAPKDQEPGEAPGG
jgi:hypothetical protein